VETIKTAD